MQVGNGKGQLKVREVVKASQTENKKKEHDPNELNREPQVFEKILKKELTNLIFNVII